MPYLKRKIDFFLNEWKNREDHNPLIVKGARQIGKTESIKKFAYKNYKSVIIINFFEEQIYKRIINDGYSASSIIKNISLIDNSKKFIDNDTLLFFDEIQEFPEIVTSLKFFKIDGRFDVICSGSLLGVNYHRVDSISVGYKEDYDMYSMDFEEFLWAKGYGEDTIESMYQHMLNGIPFSDLEKEIYNELFLDYCIIGGMPKIVDSYISSNTFSNINKMQNQILLDYKADIKKYAEGVDKARILNVFNHIPVQLAKDNKKFQVTKIDKNARFRDYRGCFEWLYDAGVINLCYCLNFPELPLKGNYGETKFKVYMQDTGLLIAMLDDEAQMDLRANKNLGVYKGAIYENIIAEALLKSGYSLYYYKRQDSTLEQDFFIRTLNSLVPIEVKSNRGKSKSLNELINNSKYDDIQFGIRLSNMNIGYSDNVYTFPRFLTFLLRRWMYEKFMK